MTYLLAFAALLPFPPDDQERPRRGRAAETPLFDFDRMEVAPVLGVALYSPDFEADPSGCGGLFFDVPMPGLWKPLGLFAEVAFSRLDRDIDDLEDPAGTLTSFAMGLDCTFLSGDRGRLLGQLGFAYGDFGGVTDVDDGGGLLIGMAAGLRLGSGVWLTYNPQFITAFFDPEVEERDWVSLHLVGVRVEF
jgi:hypothetical protein